jgi:RING-type zinc-finger
MSRFALLSSLFLAAFSRSDQVLDDPRMLDCGHSFCWACLEVHLHQHSRCPYCSALAWQKDTSKNPIAAALAGNLKRLAALIPLSSTQRQQLPSTWNPSHKAALSRGENLVKLASRAINTKGTSLQGDTTAVAHNSSSSTAAEKVVQPPASQQVYALNLACSPQPSSVLTENTVIRSCLAELPSHVLRDREQHAALTQRKSVESCDRLQDCSSSAQQLPLVQASSSSSAACDQAATAVSAAQLPQRAQHNSSVSMDVDIGSVAEVSSAAACQQLHDEPKQVQSADDMRVCSQERTVTQHSELNSSAQAAAAHSTEKLNEQDLMVDEGVDKTLLHDASAGIVDDDMLEDSTDAMQLDSSPEQSRSASWQSKLAHRYGSPAAGITPTTESSVKAATATTQRSGAVSKDDDWLKPLRAVSQKHSAKKQQHHTQAAQLCETDESSSASVTTGDVSIQQQSSVQHVNDKTQQQQKQLTVSVASMRATSPAALKTNVHQYDVVVDSTAPKGSYSAEYVCHYTNAKRSTEAAYVKRTLSSEHNTAASDSSSSDGDELQYNREPTDAGSKKRAKSSSQMPQLALTRGGTQTTPTAKATSYTTSQSPSNNNNNSSSLAVATQDDQWNRRALIHVCCDQMDEMQAQCIEQLHKKRIVCHEHLTEGVHMLIIGDTCVYGEDNRHTANEASWLYLEAIAKGLWILDFAVVANVLSHDGVLSTERLEQYELVGCNAVTNEAPKRARSAIANGMNSLFTNYRFCVVQAAVGKQHRETKQLVKLLKAAGAKSTRVVCGAQQHMQLSASDSDDDVFELDPFSSKTNKHYNKSSSSSSSNSASSSGKADVVLVVATDTGADNLKLTDVLARQAVHEADAAKPSCRALLYQWAKDCVAHYSVLEFQHQYHVKRKIAVPPRSAASGSSIGSSYNSSSSSVVPRQSSSNSSSSNSSSSKQSPTTTTASSHYSALFTVKNKAAVSAAAPSLATDLGLDDSDDDDDVSAVTIVQYALPAAQSRDKTGNAKANGAKRNRLSLPSKRKRNSEQHDVVDLSASATKRSGIALECAADFSNEGSFADDFSYSGVGSSANVTAASTAKQMSLSDSEDEAVPKVQVDYSVVTKLEDQFYVKLQEAGYVKTADLAAPATFFIGKVVFDFLWDGITMSNRLESKLQRRGLPFAIMQQFIEDKSLLQMNENIPENMAKLQRAYK